MSAGSKLQTAIYQALVANADVHALIADRIYDGARAGAAFPYVEFGPAQVMEDDAECIDGETHVLQIDVWDRSNGRLSPAKRIASAVKAALHKQDLAIANPYAIAFLRVTDMRVVSDPDGLTAHGVVTVEAAVESYPS